MATRRKILLVDDEPLVRDELGGLLEDEGYTVLTGADGEQGLQLFRDEQPDMVITDARMPRRDGLSLVAAVRAEQRATPVTVITGHGSEQMAIEALRAGVTDFIKKPVRLEDLLAALERMESSLASGAGAPPQAPAAAQLQERCWRYRLANDRDAISDFVDVLLTQCAEGVERTLLMELGLALRELLLNAIEHGNLSLSYRQKSEALERGTWDRVLAERAAEQPYAGRRVSVAARRQERQIVIEVTDQGEGFDWRALPDPTDAEHLLAAHGRGVLLARMSVDQLVFNDRGNGVTVVKRFNP